MKGYFVYMFLNEKEEPLYIGLSINLTTRIEVQHFKSLNGNLSQECIEETHSILFHTALSADDMKIKERYLINTLNPKYNTKMNNRNHFNYQIPISWEVYNFNKNELLNKRVNKKINTQVKFRNHKYNFQNNKGINLNKYSTIRCFQSHPIFEELYPELEFPSRSNGYYDNSCNFYFLKINNELYVFASEIFIFYDFNYPGDGTTVGTIKNIKKLTDEYGLDAFVLVKCKEKKGVFDMGWSNFIIPDEVLFMKYETLKKANILDNKWEILLDKALINCKKLHYNWLLGRSLTKKAVA